MSKLKVGFKKDKRCPTNVDFLKSPLRRNITRIKFFVFYQLVFYGYCGSNLEDAIAIDNVVVESFTYTTPAPGTSKSIKF
jgi:hypothetical protein